MKKVIVISAHPDDETLGVGGTLLRHKAEGDEIYWLNITNVSKEEGFSEEVVNSRQNEMSKVAELYDFNNCFLFNYPTTSLTSSSLNSLIGDISKVFNQVMPNVVYCLNRSDAHSDHRFTFQAVMACTKSFRYPFLKEVYMYECLSETEFAPQLHENLFIPNVFVDISNYMEQKLKIMSVYESEIGDHPFPRSFDNILALATYRGATSGNKYAEAFQLIKHIR